MIEQIAQYFIHEQYELGRELAKSQNISLNELANYLFNKKGISETFKENEYEHILGGFWYDFNSEDKEDFSLVFHLKKNGFKGFTVVFNCFRINKKVRYRFFLFPLLNLKGLDLINGVDLYFKENEYITEEIFQESYKLFRNELLERYVNYLKTAKDD